MEKNSKALFQPYTQVALLLLSILVLYAGSLHSPFIFDDFAFFASPETLARYGHIIFGFEPRWLPYSSLIWTINWLGLDIYWLRLGNVLLHAANVIALFFLLRRLFQVTLVNRETSTDLPASLAWLAFFGALIFALHPIAVYGVAYLIERSILMATLFVLLMLRAYLEWLVRNSWQWMLAAVLFYIAAVFSKEHSITALGVALTLTFLIRKPSPTLLKQIAPYSILLLFIAGIVVYIAAAKGILGAVYEPRAMGMLDLSAKIHGVTALPNVYLLSILTQSGLFFKYIWLWLLPNPAWMSVDMREPFAMSFLAWPYSLGMAAFLVYPGVAIWLLLKQGKAGLLGFAMLFPWILFLTEFSTVRIQEPFVLYRSYLWMPGLFAALPAVVGWLPPKKVFFPLGVICLMLVPLTLNRLDTFSSTLSLWDDAEKLVRNNPDAYGAERIYYNRGTELGQLKRYNDAVDDFTRAIAIYPFDFVYGNRATAYYFLGKYQESLRDFNHAISLNPGNANSYYGRAITYRALGNVIAAEEDTLKSCELGLCP